MILAAFSTADLIEDHSTRRRMVRTMIFLLVEIVLDLQELL